METTKPMNFADLKTGTMFKTEDDKTWIKVDCMSTSNYYNARLLGYDDTYYLLSLVDTQVVFEDDQKVILI